MTNIAKQAALDAVTNRINQLEGEINAHAQTYQANIEPLRTQMDEFANQFAIATAALEAERQELESDRAELSPAEIAG